jgi:signal peptidase I
MEPTIYTDDILLSEHITPRLQRIKKGDIIIAKSPSNPRIHICKRVAGMPGDKVLVGFSLQMVCLKAYTLLQVYECYYLLLKLLKWCLINCSATFSILGQSMWDENLSKL